ncbi:hypothetical protein A2U01_0070776 [Trifolium medium]|uniref:Uncharacterized protein n=1 Tax=Trifolium medium TaxID=97028 RepID=A0A392SM90_9FABA|nr:hypothetical protein [Trifolium medium]
MMGGEVGRTKLEQRFAVLVVGLILVGCVKKGEVGLIRLLVAKQGEVQQILLTPLNLLRKDQMYML